MSRGGGVGDPMSKREDTVYRQIVNRHSDIENEEFEEMSDLLAEATEKEERRAH